MRNTFKIKVAKYISKLFILLFKLRYGRRVKFGRGVIVNHKFKFRGPGALILADAVNLWCHAEPNQFLTFSKDAVIKIGKSTRINGATFQARKLIEVGEDCLIGSTIIMDNDFHSIYVGHRNDPAHIKTFPVKIKDRSWIAGQSAILKGVTIGEEAAVGFRAVVTKDVESKTVVAGNPAQVVKRLVA